MKKIFTLFIIFSIGMLIFSTGCRKKIRITGRDTSIDTSNAYNKIFLDSITLRKFTEIHKIPETTADRMISFYSARNYAYAWFSPEGIPEQTHTFWNILKNYVSYSADSSVFEKSFAQKMENILILEKFVIPHDSAFKKMEMELTYTFFKYASKAYEGRDDFDMKSLEWFIPRKQVNTTALLDSLVINKGKKLDKYEPVNEQYRKLRASLFKYRNIQSAGGWQKIAWQGKSLKKGERNLLITATKKRLATEGHFPTTDTSDLYNDELESTINGIRLVYGLSANGEISKSLIDKLNKPVGERIEQILINMERMRWLPDNIRGNYIIVNIPEYMLHVYEQDKPAWNMNVVVGKESTGTTIFTGNLTTIVFSPYWGVPTSIVKNEIMPKLRGSYLSRNHMEIYGYAGNIPLIRQKPGPWNSLGAVKFLFPNSYNIYFHDSPAKSLFNENKRSFSHGCIRLKEPFKMAQYLLRNDTLWNDEKIKAAMNKTTETYVKLKNPVPVLIAYFTTWVDDNGNLNFRDDIYGHDKKMAEKMFTKKADTAKLPVNSAKK